jgi:ribosomal protein S12 methylthiotransferase accessory factor
MEEAIFQGFLELVERDSIALWWYNRVRRPGVDLESFGEPYLGQLQAYLGQRQREFWVLDLTSDLGIPVFAAISRRRAAQERILLGFGAHLDPRLAMLRAVSELNQMLCWLLSEEEENLPSALPPEDEVRYWFETVTLDNQPYLAVDTSVPLRKRADFPHAWSDDLREDVLSCQRLVEKQGMEMMVLDQTRPDIGLCTVKVFVLGLRHFWPRFAPGRLYDVPVRLGWMSNPLPEEDLNPYPMFV